jgi:hypothetical protein
MAERNISLVFVYTESVIAAKHIYVNFDVVCMSAATNILGSRYR